MKEIALLGGSRFIGVHLIQALCQQGHKVTIFNRHLTLPPVPYPKGTRLVRGDRNNPESLRRLFDKKYDVVFDISGYTPKHVEPIALEYRSCIGHYIFCSTTAVYKVPPPYPINENAPRIFDKNTYGGDKALVENLLLNHYKENQWPITIFRLQNVFGPYKAAIVGFTFYRLINSLPLLINNDFRANILFVDDLVTAFLSAMNNPISYGKIYGLAGDDIVSPLEFVELCGKISAYSPILTFNSNSDLFKAYNDRFLFQLSYNRVFDCSKVKSELGMEFTPFGEAVNKTFLWVKENPSHLKRYALRGEKYVLNNLSIPMYAKGYWKGVDLLKWCRSKIARIKLLKNSYRLLVSRLRHSGRQ